jgi:hypothetical protein
MGRANADRVIAPMTENHSVWNLSVRYDPGKTMRLNLALSCAKLPVPQTGRESSAGPDPTLVSVSLLDVTPEALDQDRIEVDFSFVIGRYHLFPPILTEIPAEQIPHRIAPQAAIPDPL